MSRGPFITSRCVRLSRVVPLGLRAIGGKTAGKKTAGGFTVQRCSAAESPPGWPFAGSPATLKAPINMNRIRSFARTCASFVFLLFALMGSERHTASGTAWYLPKGWDVRRCTLIMYIEGCYSSCKLKPYCKSQPKNHISKTSAHSPTVLPVRQGPEPLRPNSHVAPA